LRDFGESRARIELVRMTRTLRGTVEYDGTAFAGFQKQPRLKTVQGILETAIGQVTQQTATVVGAGRTDAGVHALGQVVHFETGSSLSTGTLERAVNACLPAAVRIRCVEEVDSSFHARFSAKSREYRYLVENAVIASPLWRDRAYQVAQPLDVEAMGDGATLLQGRHDFAPFGTPMKYSRHSGEGSELVEVSGGTERTMLAADCWRQQRFVHFRFVADAFLRHMVRMIVGTLLRIGRGALSVQVLARMLQGDRLVSAGPAVPAHGLYLVRVRY